MIWDVCYFLIKIHSILFKKKSKFCKFCYFFITIQEIDKDKRRTCLHILNRPKETYKLTLDSQKHTKTLRTSTFLSDLAQERI